jgi:hypothetical protein
LVTFNVAENQLTVVAPAAVQNEVARFLKQADSVPPLVVIKCEIARIDSDGKRTVLSRPTIRSHVGQQAAIITGTFEGEKLEFLLTPQVEFNPDID